MFAAIREKLNNNMTRKNKIALLVCLLFVLFIYVVTTLLKSENSAIVIFEEDANHEVSFHEINYNISNTSPQELARISFLEGDYRYAAYRGYMITSPEAISNFLDVYGYKVIARTTDSFSHEDEIHFMRNAVIFAEKYNQELNQLHDKK
ncbi:MAG: hypothetical protein ACNA8L_09265 [Luteolibacter sp.]